LSYSPAWFKNITKQLGKLKLNVHAQPLQDELQTEVTQVSYYHAFDCPPCPGGEEKSYPTEASHAQKYGEGVKERTQYSGHEENGFRTVAFNNIVEAKVKAAVTISD